MELYADEIFQGIDIIPIPNHPGVVIVTGESQPIFTGENSNETFFAGCKYGDGKIVVLAHEQYLDWFHERNDQDCDLKLDFMNNLKIWLTGENLPNSKIIDFGELIRKEKSFDEYKLIKWHQDFDPSEEDQTNLLKHIKRGGSLLCATTPWAYLQIWPNKKLNDMKMYRFLIEHTGIILTSNTLNLPEQIFISKNKAKFSQFNTAIEKISLEFINLDLYYETIVYGLEVLSNENLAKNPTIIDLKNFVREFLNKKIMNKNPSEKNIITNKDEKKAIKLIEKCLYFADGEKAPGIEEFPGDFETLPSLLENIELVLEAKFEERLSTGYYLPAGINLLVKVISGEIDGWSIRIGAHCDDLSDCESYKRWPCVSLVKTLTAEMSIYSPFGGLIYLESPGSGIIIINVSNVVESPFYDLKKPETVTNWIKRKNAPGLWAELVGENIIFTTPSSCIRHIDNPKNILQFWDSIVKTHHECRGTNVNDYRKERIVNDIQPYVGYMHSGYPIVTHLDCCQPEHEYCIFDLEKSKLNINWGLFHQLGRNFQRKEWTFEGSSEVTVYIFSMHAIQNILGQDVINQAWLIDKKKNFKKYFSKKPTFKDWKNDYEMACVTFAQLIKHFGWSSMQKFLKEFEEDIKYNQDRLPKTDQEKIDQWVVRYSKIVSKNIAPQFQMFGLPVSKAAKKELNGLKQWLPKNEKDPNVFFSK